MYFKYQGIDFKGEAVLLCFLYRIQDAHLENVSIKELLYKMRFKPVYFHMIELHIFGTSQSNDLRAKFL